MVIARPSARIASCLLVLAVALTGCSATQQGAGGARPSVPALPRSGPLPVDRDIRVTARQLADADPCALIDRDALSMLGRAKLGLGQQIRSCDAEFALPAGGMVDVEAQFAPRPDNAGPPDRSYRGVAVYGGRAAADGTCARSVVAATDAVLTITAGGAADPARSACRNADRAIDAAASRLLHGGLPPAHYPADSLARQDACRLITPQQAARVPGSSHHRYAGYRGQYCQWGDGPVSRPGLYLAFDLSDPLRAGDGLRPVTVAGQHAFVHAAKANSFELASCEVRFIHGPAYRPSVLGDHEMIDIVVRADRSAGSDCSLATAFAAEALGRLPRHA